MQKYILIGFVLALMGAVAVAGQLDCNLSKTGVSYKAEVINDGTMNRSV